MRKIMAMLSVLVLFSINSLMPLSYYASAENAEDSQENDGKLEQESVKTEEDDQGESEEDSIEQKQIEDDSKLDMENKQGEITPFAGNLNFDMTLNPVKDEIESGNAAIYKLKLRVTGAKTTYNNATLTLKLPQKENVEFTQKLEELKINNVTPTYDNENHTLQYSFDQLKSGQSYETLLKLKTINGLVADGTELAVKAQFNSDELLAIEDSALTIVKSSTPISIQKKYDKILGIDNDVRPVFIPGRESLWAMKSQIGVKNKGLMYLQEDSIIKITVDVPEQLEYIKMESGLEPTTHDGNKLIWEIDAPTIEGQKELIDYLFTNEMKPVYKAKEGTEKQRAKFNVMIEATTIDGKQITATDQSSILILSDKEATEEVDGEWFVPGHFSPVDAYGNHSADFAALNKQPTVYPWATVTFGHMITALEYGLFKDYNKYVIEYHVNSKFDLKEFKTPGEFKYRPTNTYPTGVVLPEQPQYNVTVELANGTKKEFNNLQPNTIITREMLELDDQDKVTNIIYEFTKAPAGMIIYDPEPNPNTGVTDMPTYTFTIDENYRSEDDQEEVVKIENTLDMYTKVSFPAVDIEQEWLFSNPNEYGNLAGPRWIFVTEEPEEKAALATTSIELMDSDKGEVIPGDNRVKVMLQNEAASTNSIQNPLEAVFMLPIGVTLKADANDSYTKADGTNSNDSGTFEVLDDDYNGSGRQLVKVTWNDEVLRQGQQVTAEFDVTISKNKGTTYLPMSVFGYTGNETIEAPVNEKPTSQDTVVEVDVDDLIGNGNKEQLRLKSMNAYTLVGHYDIQTKKYVKGNLDTDYTDFGHTTLGGKVDYKLELTNRSNQVISDMVLIDVLPSENDLGITDNISRGSKFTPTLTGPIILPEEWEGKVDVFYSKVLTPKRDELIDGVDYDNSTEKLSNPVGAENPNWTTEADVGNDWEKIRSFKIELKEDVEWVLGEDIVIEFTMLAPKELEADLLDETVNETERATWNSFAITTNKKQPVEPMRVGFVVDHPTLDIPITKTWKDAGVKDRPSKIEVELLQNGKVIDMATITAEKDWKHTFEDLDKMDKDGKAYVYTISEKEVEGYDSTIEEYNITNVRVGKTEVAGTKTWKDDDSQDRPKNITVKLLQNGEEINSQEVTAEDNWTYSFIDLDEFDENGVAYEYTVEEDSVKGYASTIDGYDITNVRIGKTDVSGMKTWKDDNVEDRPDSIKVNLLQNGIVVDTKEVTAEDNWTYSFTDLEKYNTEGNVYEYTVTEQQVPGYQSEVNGFDIVNTRSDKITIEVTKAWLDDKNEDRPGSITVTILQNGEDYKTVVLKATEDWTYIFEDLEAFDESGVAYEYTVEEEPVKGYESTIDGYDITNLRTGKIDIAVTKTWEDDNSQKRPSFIEVNLLRNGEKIETVKVTEDSDWKYRFTDLEKYDETGKPYSYTVQEIPVEGYETVIKETSTGYDIINKIVEEPVKPEDPKADPIKPDSDNKEDLNKKDEEDKFLPNTATSIFNMLFIGTLLIVMGILFHRKKKTI